MNHQQYDRQGREYAKVSSLKTGDQVTVDGNFTCLKEGAILPVKKNDDGDLYVDCAVAQYHLLDGQLNDTRTHYVGIYSLPPFDPVRDIEEFHKKFDLAYDGKPRCLPDDLSTFRQTFLREELSEYHFNAYQPSDLIDEEGQSVISSALEHQLDALVDLVYVALGTSYLHGFDFREAWRRVHAANMRKVRASGADDPNSMRHHAADVVKPPGWTPPSHLDLVKDHAHMPPQEQAQPQDRPWCLPQQR